jgi:ATP-dependent DNA helicase RecG
LGVVLDVNLLSEDGLDVIEIDVPALPMPIACKGSYYYRSGATNKRLSGSDLESFLMTKRGRIPDEIPMPDVRLAELDPARIRLLKDYGIRTKRLDESVRERDDGLFLEKLRLIERGAPHLCRSAAVPPSTGRTYPRSDNQDWLFLQRKRNTLPRRCGWPTHGAGRQGH